MSDVKRTPAEKFRAAKINRYDHGGGRVFTEEPRELLADFYEEAEREYAIEACQNYDALASRLAEAERRVEELERAWIRVDEKLPENFRRVPVWNGQIESAYCDQGVWFGYLGCVKPTHWIDVATPPPRHQSAEGAEGEGT